MKVLFTILSVFAACAVSAQNTVSVSWRDSSSVRISIAMTESGDSVGSNYAVRAVPVIAGAHGDTLRLEPTVFRGKRNMRYIERARYYGTAGPSVGNEVPLGSSNNYNYDVDLTRKDYPWLWDDEISFTVERTKEGCCDVIPMATARLGSSIYVPPFVPVLADVPDNTGKAGQLERDNPVLQHISKYRPYDNTRVLRKEAGALYVHFPLDKTVIEHAFRDNGPTLDRIVSITRDIMADSTSSVKVIQIIGLASVEGSVAHNSRLAGERAVALKRYIQSRVATADSLYECVNGADSDLTLGVSNVEGDTINSHTRPMFSARTDMPLDGRNEAYRADLYMVNSAVALVLADGTASPTAITGVVDGMATGFAVNDSTYSFGSRQVVRMIPLITGGYHCLYAATMPSREAVTGSADDGVWRLKVYVTIDGKITENVLHVAEPLRAGGVKIIKGVIKDDGSVTTESPEVGVSVTLDWKPGGDHDIEI